VPMPPPPRTPDHLPIDHEALIEQAYDGERHRLSDARAVDAVVSAHAALLDGAEDSVGIVSLWLDTAAGLRRAGAAVTPQAIMVEVSRQRRKCVGLFSECS
jgi:hypothetical protein